MEKVYINSLPKAGTHFLASILVRFGYKRLGHIDSYMFLNRGLIKSQLYRFFYNSYFAQGFIIGLDFPVEMSRIKIKKLFKKTKEGEFYTGHNGYTEDLLKEILENGIKVIQIIRDPRAIIASWVPFSLKYKWHPFHHIMKKLETIERYKAVLYGFKSEKISLLSMKTRCNALKPWLENDNVFVVKFEDLIGTQGGGSYEKQIKTIKSLLQYIGEDSSDATIEKILNALNRKELSKSDKKRGLKFSTYRKGNIDAWKSEIPYQLQEEMNKILTPILNEWSYKI